MKKNATPTANNNEKIKKTSPVKYFFGGIFASLLIVFLLSFLFLLGYYFDIGDLKDKTINFMGVDKEQELRLKYRESEVNKMLEEINTSMNEIKAEQKLLRDRQENLNSKEEKLQEWESRLSGEEIDKQSIIAIFKEMDSKMAAEILSVNPENPDIVTIIKNIGEKKAAAILSHMDAEMAAKILDNSKKD